MILRTLLLLLIPAFTSCAQEEQPLLSPTLTTIVHRLGESNIPIAIRSYSDTGKLFLVHLHGDEQTASQAAQYFLEREGGRLLSIENGSERNISFQLAGRAYKIDPNRIFHPQGIENSLRILSRADEEAITATQKLATRLTAAIPDSVLVIALHNNTDGRYSVLDYEGLLKDEAAAVFIHPDMDTDNFIFTTDVSLFEHFRQNGFNAVLQKDSLAQDDGSLSAYFGKRKRSYINLEAEHGAFEVQLKMLYALLEFIRKKEKV